MNPDTAQRCDCGYDFQSKNVGKPYFRQGLPAGIKTYFTLVLIVNVLWGIRAIGTARTFTQIEPVLFAAVVYPLYVALLNKKNWARIALAIMTFPLGTVLLLTQEVRLYVMQKD